MRIAIVGPGAVSSFFGDRLAQGGHEVVVLAQARNPAPRGPVVDAVLVEVHRPVSAAVERARPLLKDEHPFVVPLVDGDDAREGIDALDAFSAAFGADRVVGGRGSVLPQPKLTLGEATHETSGRVVRLALAFEEAGVRAEVSLDIHAALS